MSEKLVASDVTDERVMRTARGRHCRMMMAERRDAMSSNRMTDRLGAVVQEQRTVTHLREQ